MAKELDTEKINEDLIIEMTSEDGDTFYCREEMIIPVNGEKYALLVPIELDDEGYEVESDAEEDEAFFAKIVMDEDGEESYIEPTEEEFDAVVKAYEALDFEEASEEK